MIQPTGHILLLGYGNPGRLDDGLGAAFCGEIEKMDLPGVNIEADYQLTVEGYDSTISDAGDSLSYHNGAKWST